MPFSISILNQRADFLRLNRAPKVITPYFALRHAPNGREDCRVGFTVTTQCGNAVIRNRIKRRLRALVHELFPQHAKPGHDYVLIALAQASPSAADAPFDTLRNALADALKRVP